MFPGTWLFIQRTDIFVKTASDLIQSEAIAQIRQGYTTKIDSGPQNTQGTPLLFEVSFYGAQEREELDC